MPAIRMAEGSSDNLFLRHIFSLAEPDVPILVKGEPGSANRFVENLFLNTTPVAETADEAAGWDSVWESNDFQPRPNAARFDTWEPPPSLYLHQKRLVSGAVR